MKYISLILSYVFFINSAVAALPPTTMSGQKDTSKITTFNFQSPNNTATKVDGATLIETGNKNLLPNASFEHSVFDTSWSIVSGTTSVETVDVVHGNKALKAVMSASPLEISHTSPSNNVGLTGVQGLTSIMVKSNVAGIKVCSRTAFVTSTTNCVNVLANNRWGLYKVPTILGATSNGISINSNGTSVTGTVYIDDSFVGAQDLTPNMNACNSVSCETEFSAVISSTGVVTTENGLDWINGNCTNAFPNVCTFNSNIFTIVPSCAVVSVAGTQTVSANISSQSISSVSVRNSTNASSEATAFNLICQKQGADFTAAKQLSNGNTYSSTNADTDWASCGHTAASFTGFGTVTAIETQCKRQGSDLLMKGKFTSGISTAVEARVSLPVWNGVQLTSAGSNIIASIQQAGTATTSGAAAGNFHTLIETLISYVTFSYETSSVSGLTKANGSTLLSTGISLSLNARIPIAGWLNSNIIIGQFNGLESCTSTLDCTDTFSAKISSAGVVSGENVDWLDGNCSNPTTGTYNCTIKTGIFTVIPNCTATAEGSVGSPNTAMLNITSATALSAYLRNTSNTLQSSVWNVVCQKQGVDYIGKTAKAVASDQNVATPGQTKAVLVSALVTDGASTTTVSQDDSDFVNGNCTNPSPGSYTCTFNTNYFSAQPHCWVQGFSSSRFSQGGSVSASSFSVIFETQALLASDIPSFYLFCKGPR